MRIMLAAVLATAVPMRANTLGDTNSANTGTATGTVRIAADDRGGGTTNNADVLASVSGVNDPPTIANAIPNQNATEDAAFNFQFAANAFADPDAGASLTYAAQLAGGGALPAWRSFDAATRTFCGTPASRDRGTLVIEARTYLVAPASRLTIDLGADVPEARDRASSATLRSSNAVVVEASRYWDADGVRWSAGVNLRATPLP